MAERTGFHQTQDWLLAAANAEHAATGYHYTFTNFFHPFVGQLIQKLNESSLAGFLDPTYLQQLAADFFTDYYTPNADGAVTVDFPRKEIDLSIHGPYANYNWELFFHVPMTIAVHLSNNQRFAEAQHWFHYLFDPTSTDLSVPAPYRYWKFLGFRQHQDVRGIEELLRLLSSNAQADSDAKKAVLDGYARINDHPFQPHLVAETRPVSYQYHVVMKYLDNLISWGDSLFREGTAEAIGEASQRYILAANILGPRPQQLPPRGTRVGQSFAQLKAGLDAFGNALVELEGQFPFNFTPGPTGSGTAAGASTGIGRTSYFCLPRNDRLLAYWDRVADRLFKVRNCLDLNGMARQLPLFDPPIDPGLLVKATAAGVDAAAELSSLLQPVGPLRAGYLLQHALDLSAEVRSLGGALLSAIEKTDAEELAQLRQSNEVKVQDLVRDVRFLQWRQAEAATDALLRSRDVTLERYRYYRRLLGLDDGGQPVFTVARPAPAAEPLLTEATFDKAHAQLVGQYDVGVPVQSYAELKLVGGSSPATSAGATSSGQLNLTTKEDQELNQHLPAARDLHAASSILDTVASVVTFIPELDIDLHFWGLGLHSNVFGGSKLAQVSRIAADIVRTAATWEQDQAGMAARSASYERRADEWAMAHNLAARELSQLGRQILTSVIAEQAAHQEYRNVLKLTEQAQGVLDLLRSKYTNQELYGWLQGELTKLYNDYYRFAVDLAHKAEQAINRELLPADGTGVPYIKPSYWDTGRRGLLAGEALVLDLRRLELAYREGRQREYELTKHVSLGQLDPLALLELKATGSCQISIPESLFDLDCPGHYLRRISRVSLSVPAVTGPYTSLNCTLSLLRSSVRASALAADYPRRDGSDDRFADYLGTISSIVTSGGHEDSGLFDAAARDERFGPFEGAGAISSWRLELPNEYRQFDYDTIPDVILHLRYTAREGGSALRDAAVSQLNKLVADAQATGTTRLFSIRQEFPSEWARLVGGTGRTELALQLREEHYPYWSRGLVRQVRGAQLFARPADAGTGSLQVFDGAESTARGDTLDRDAGYGLLRGELKNIALPAAVGPVSLFFDDPALADLWLVLNWAGPSG